MRHESWNLTGAKHDTQDAEADTHAALAQEFDAWADAGRGDRMEKGHWPTARQALERVPWATTRRFVDLGCGNGYAVRHAASRMAEDGEAIGIDVSPRMVDAATRATETWLANGRDRRDEVATARFEVARFDALPFDDGSVDVVFSNEALYYAPDVDAALGEVFRVLGPGGRFVCGIDYFEENAYSHDWAEKVGVPMARDSVAGWMQRLGAAGLVDVTSERLLDPAGVPEAAPAADADGAADDAARTARAAHDALVRWKTEVGTLLLCGVRAG